MTMQANCLLRYMLTKTAGIPLGSFFRGIVPSFEQDAAKLAPGIAHPPYLKPGIMSRVITPPVAGPGPSIPRLASDPALEAKSVFKAPPAEQAPTGRYVRPSVQSQHEYFAQHASPAVTTTPDDLRAEESDLADKLKRPGIDEGSRAAMQARMSKIYDQLESGPALQLNDPVAHQAALAARAQKIQEFMARQRAAVMPGVAAPQDAAGWKAQLAREAIWPAKPAGDASTRVNSPFP